MGCWNKTCGLTGLPIHAGTPVYVFALISQPGSYSGEYWTPVLAPFYAVYDDYGGGENNTGITLPYILNELSNQCIDKSVLFDIDSFYESIRNETLKVLSWDEKPTHVSFTMMHKSIVDNILDNFAIKKYVGDGNGNCGYENAYISHTYADFVKDIPGLLESLKSENEVYAYDWALNGTLMSLAEKHISAIYFQRNIEASNIASATEYICHWKKGNIPDSDIIPLLSELLKGIILDRFLISVRKTWAPGAYEGSQHDAIEGYEVMCNAMLTHIEQRKKEDEDDQNEE
jgi:hypothetical protein